ncbi:hypothetical protein [Mesorhizobium sp. M00.F.Ca.ET.216.01.1.1]|uniref:hypothetical protein n=1 Tax=Mesorhizobium sp. M00.F.Ca.ET.216.01.1.1 TaxID=2500528 RepID=UPI000FE133A7|nr:hypothetical protein [Mesorhizobium sp. M00.F.Ca.ET.216.01.1.1]TGQ41182.1 hypothetical protein EN859_012580 [Mesorhizobium sp. M00.F.Ca.ET.216.01.1.1]
MKRPHHYSDSQLRSICRQFLRGDGRPTEAQLRSVMARCREMIEINRELVDRFLEKKPGPFVTKDEGDEEFVRCLTKAPANVRAQLRREVTEYQQQHPFKRMLAAFDEAERRLRQPRLRLIRGGKR